MGLCAWPRIGLRSRSLYSLTGRCTTPPVWACGPRARLVALRGLAAVAIGLCESSVSWSGWPYRLCEGVLSHQRGFAPIKWLVAHAPTGGLVGSLSAPRSP